MVGVHLLVPMGGVDYISQKCYNVEFYLFLNFKRLLAAFWRIHLMQDDAPAQRTNKSRTYAMLGWPSNFPILNPIENAWNLMKNEDREAQPSNITLLIDISKRLWVTVKIDYFES